MSILCTYFIEYYPGESAAGEPTGPPIARLVCVVPFQPSEVNSKLDVELLLESKLDVELLPEAMHHLMAILGADPLAVEGPIVRIIDSHGI